MQWIVRVGRETIDGNVRQKADPGAVDTGLDWRGVQIGYFPDVRLRRRSSAGVVAERNVSDVFVRRIKDDTRDIEIGNGAPPAHRIQTGQGAGTGGGEPKRAVVVADEPVVIVLRSNADRADGNAADQRRLADDHVGGSLGARAIQAVGAEVDGIVRADPGRARSGNRS